MTDKGNSPKNLSQVIQNVLFIMINKPGGIICMIAILGIIVIGIIYWNVKIDPKYSPFAIGTIIFLVLLGGFSYLLFPKPHPDEPSPVHVTEQELKGRYFIGIDVGRDKIDYCLIDYDKFEKKPDNPEWKLKDGRKDTPTNFDEIFNLLGDIITELSKYAKNERINYIDGIGFGLPGQVNPGVSKLIMSPGFPDVKDMPFVSDFSKCLKRYWYNQIQHTEILDGKFRILIDNDVRCATRYIWKKERFDDVICIFVGNGLGSGIVLGGQLLYGHNFMAGEIGHTTITSEHSNLLEGKKCKCNRKGYHWEMYASSYGMIDIAKNLDSTEYLRLKEELKEKHPPIIQGEESKKLLNDPKFSEHSKEWIDKKGDLTTYFFSFAFHRGDIYTCKVVKEFIKYLSIGIANYINVINPETVYLGGGMIEGFFTNKSSIDTIDLLQKEVEEYILPSASRFSIKKLDFEERTIASIGAALIFKDQSYMDYKNREKSERR